MRRLGVVAVALVVAAVTLVADASSFVYDPRTDFAVFKTFAIRNGAVDSARPELDNSLFVKKLGTVIRAALTERRLTEDPKGPGLFVDYRITNGDISTTQRGVGMRGNGMVISSPGPQPLRYTQGTLVIDLVKPGESVPVWRALYRDDEPTGSKLVQKLLADAKDLIAKFPPKK